MRITEHVYYLSGDCYGLSGNAFGISTDKGMILIDTGKVGEGHSQIEETMKYYGLDMPITHVLLTHGHFDHAGDAKYFQDSGAKICISKIDAESHLKNGGMYSEGEVPLNASLSEKERFPALEADYTFAGEETFEVNGLQFHVYPAPGHTAGGVVYEINIDGRDIMFVGDFIVLEGPRCLRSSLGWPGSPDFSKDAYLNSLRFFAEKNPDIILCGHRCFKLKNGLSAFKNALSVGMAEL